MDLFASSTWERVTRAVTLRDERALKALSTEPGPPAKSEADLRSDRIARQMRLRPWRPASLHEALGVPSIFEAVTLLSNVVGIFTLEAFYKGERVADDQRPRLIVRPNPFTTLRDYLRETVWSMATRGENWQWIGSRDTDNLALSVIPVPSREVEVSGDWMTPTVKWRKVDKTRDMVSVFLTKELGDLRGRGPLQYCGAAISAAVESQEWAANFFADGGNPNVHMHSEDELKEGEAQQLREQWVNTPPNMPQVTSGPLTVEVVGGPNEGSAQMLDARNFNAGESARMFQMPGPLLEFSRGGSSLTYQNVATLMDQLVRQCVWPNYLEPIEQMLTDLLPRNWVTRFNVDAFLRADIQTRFNVYKIGLETGVFPDVRIPQAAEGIVAGSVENAPVPYAPPAAFPTDIPSRRFSAPAEVRCASCHKLLGKLTPPYEVVCQRCKTLALSA